MGVSFKPDQPVQPAPTVSKTDKAPNKHVDKPAVPVVKTETPPPVADKAKVKPNVTQQAKFDAVAYGKQAYDETMKDDHWSNEAATYWDQVIASNDKAVGDGKRDPYTATAVHVGATVMGFFVEMSGIRQVRARAGQLGAEVGGDAPTGEIAKTSLLLGGETLLAASNGLGIGSGVGRAAKVSAEGAAIIRGAEAVKAGDALVGAVVNGGDDVARVVAAQVATKGAKAIEGMRAVKGVAAEAVTKELQQLVRQLPLEGGKVTKLQAQAFLNELKQVASRYGIVLKEGGVAGEAVGGARDLVVSLKTGAAHEMVHALQMVQVRAAAFADEALRLGTSIAEMPPSGFERAYTAVVKPFEHQAYAVFESMAFKATGLMGRANAIRYRAALTEGLKAFGDGLANAAKPVFKEGLAARLYGELTILGRSQVEIGSKIAMGLKPAYEMADKATKSAMEKLLGP
jgi:hypothetical protein